MSESMAGPRTPEGTGAEDVGVVYAGDYVNKLSGQRIERECLGKLEGGCRALVIDFRETELVNSIGVSILFGVIELAERCDARLVFSNVNRHTFKLFELLGLTRHVALADNEESALATLGEFSTPLPPGH